jgi:hypothetical protein
MPHLSIRFTAASGSDVLLLSAETFFAGEAEQDN